MVARQSSRSRLNATPPGANTTASREIESSRPGPRCTATTASGRPCRARPRTGSTLCLAHDPSYDETRRQNGRSGGERAALNNRTRRQVRPYVFKHLRIADPHDLGLVIDALLRLEITGRLPPARTRNLIRIVHAAQRNLALHRNCDEFDAHRRRLDDDLFQAIIATGQSEQRRRLDDIGYESAARETLHHDLERWPNLDRRSAAVRQLDRELEDWTLRPSRLFPEP
jgi:hypothetical protein